MVCICSNWLVTSGSWGRVLKSRTGTFRRANSLVDFRVLLSRVVPRPILHIFLSSGGQHSPALRVFDKELNGRQRLPRGGAEFNNPREILRRVLSMRSNDG